MSSNFTPSNAVDMSKERDWPANLGMLDWDDTSIVFTKRSLIEFLKYTGTTVDTNFYNISKLPKYAKFGKLSEATQEQVKDALEVAGSANAANGFRPSRRVRDVPGGSHTDIFAADEDDALSAAPPKPEEAKPAQQAPVSRDTADDEHQGIDFGSSFKPSRRVRENPGGNSSLSNFWDADEQESFKPTRRVRERPGGKDSISGIF
ncbi:hypothetical protein CPB83DRAFT_845108 [Crepidotus variabilis]|uniref:Uncharacterized protein n=1 Tax=Crepidotus variabilis TaxID=179855 RepID=A0A9P6JVD3_9AGAR|nr:hypothetical protein CPB83DRAFT_845108 [Crepidotus variabilis]